MRKSRRAGHPLLPAGAPGPGIRSGGKCGIWRRRWRGRRRRSQYLEAWSPIDLRRGMTAWSNGAARSPSRATTATEGLSIGQIAAGWGARRRRSRRTSNAPRGALLYPRRSREGLGGGSLGLMAYRDPKGERDKRMPEKRRSSPGVRGGASRDPRDMAKAGLPDSPIPRRRKGQSAGTTPETGAMLCGGIVEGPLQPPERGALPSEGNQGDECCATRRLAVSPVQPGGIWRNVPGSDA